MEQQQATQIVCEQCQHTTTIPVLQHRQRAVCPQCGHTLLTFRHNAIENTLAYSLSALVFMLLSLPFNFLSFRASGQQHTINLPGGLKVLIENDYLSLAIITGLATLVLPGTLLIGLICLTLASLYNYRPPFLRRVHLWVTRLMPWSMAEIFLVGTLVSLTKITAMAEVSIGMSFYAFIGFTVCMTASLFYFDRDRMALWIYEGNPPAPAPLSAQAASYSIQRTWALLATATLLYIPANMLPIMHTEYFGRDEPSTIVGGAITLWQSGSYPIALVILFASVAVPVVKILILAWLNFSVQQGHLYSQNSRIRYYRITEWIGRWSMIDVFVVAILVALIQLGNAISIYPGPAALAFCAVVFITMIAAMSFDSRLIWLSRKQYQ
ncbi:paraquat-inducible protein A [Alteromonas aestuariivivens]|uniref:Paraquat-inducible protein A n=1 Tax=Alteromonas aestuariivivens TaxID=1938339 RepID=A0A3D8M3W6_9ALTE|nr:paraquat-inducible protein A [Alteromonas aestuariivivens]RDV24245.1 paraquat-inducible protein A [Alteromonas aestuariivivens]